MFPNLWRLANWRSSTHRTRRSTSMLKPTPNSCLDRQQAIRTHSLSESTRCIQATLRFEPESDASSRYVRGCRRKAVSNGRETIESTQGQCSRLFNVAAVVRPLQGRFVNCVGDPGAPLRSAPGYYILDAFGVLFIHGRATAPSSHSNKNESRSL